MMLRSFIAVNIPSEIQNAVARSILPLQRILSKPLVRWVPFDNVHLTLKFLGDVSPDNLARLADALRGKLLIMRRLLSLLADLELSRIHTGRVSSGLDSKPPLL